MARRPPPGAAAGERQTAQRSCEWVLPRGWGGVCGSPLKNGGIVFRIQLGPRSTVRCQRALSALYAAGAGKTPPSSPTQLGRHAALHRE